MAKSSILTEFIVSARNILHFIHQFGILQYLDSLFASQVNLNDVSFAEMSYDPVAKRRAELKIVPLNLYIAWGFLCFAFWLSFCVHCFLAGIRLFIII
jgi:hypothetical protein